MNEFDPLMGAEGEGDLNEIMEDLVSVFGSAQVELPLEIPPIVDSLVLDADQILVEFGAAEIREEGVEAGGEATRGGAIAQETTRGGRVEENSWEDEVLALSQAGATDERMGLEEDGEDLVKLKPVRIGISLKKSVAVVWYGD